MEVECISLIVGLVALLVALLMAVPTVLDLIWGRPKIEVEFSMMEFEWGKALVCKLYNRRIGNPIGRRLVRRQAMQDPVVRFSIEEAGRKIAIGIEPEIRLKSGLVASPTVNLPPSRSGFRWFSVVVWDNQKSSVSTAELHPVELKRGEYDVEVEIDEDKPKRRSFIVGQTKQDLDWKEN